MSQFFIAQKDFANFSKSYPQVLISQNFAAFYFS